MAPQDNAPILNAPVAVRWLVSITVVAHLVRVLATEKLDNTILEVFGFMPARFGLDGAGSIGFDGLLVMAVGHMFLHADWMHLVLNMAFLLAFGSAVGRRMGAIQFLLLYLLCGLAAAFFWAWLYPPQVALLLGASGAISGMVGAAARVSIWPPHSGSALPFWRRSTVISFVVIWLALNIGFGIFPIFLSGDYGGVAWEAHLGGFIAGFLLIGVFDGRGRIEVVAPPYRFL